MNVSRRISISTTAAAVLLACGGEEPAPAEAPMALHVSAEPPGFMFEESAKVELLSSRPARIFYTLDGSSPTHSALEYTEPLELTSSTLVSFIALSDDGVWSPPGSELYQPMPNAEVPESLPRMLEFSPDGLFFTAEAGDRMPMQRTIAIRCIGREQVVVRRIALVPNEKGFGFFEDGAFEIVSGAEPRVLAPGELMELVVSYRPTETLRSAAIALESNDQRSDGLKMIELWGRILDL